MVIALVFSVVIFPIRVRGYLLPVLPIALLAYDPAAQARAAFREFPYDVLREADRVLPANARVLLVTDGHDARHREYTTWHRALYFLTPRPVYWMSPAPSDGTWEARWWITAPLDQASIAQLARQTNSMYVLLLADVEWANANPVAQWSDGELLTLGPSPTESGATTGRDFADTDSSWKLALAILSIIAAGTLPLTVAMRFGFRPSRVESLALFWILGAGVVGFGMVCLSVLGLPLWLQVTYLTVVAFASAGWTISQARPTRLARFTFHPSLRSSALFVWLAVQTCFVAIVALGQPLVYWDSWVTWSMKARAIFLEQGIGAPVFADPSREITHLDYPLLLSSLEAWVYQWLGAPDDRFVGWIAVGFYLSLLGLIYGGARRLGVDASRALLTTAVLGSIPTLTLLAGQAIADVPFAVYALLTALALLEWLAHGARGALFLALCGAACVTWTKREGLVFTLALAASTLLLAAQKRRAWSGALACALTAVLVAGAWGGFLAAQGTVNTDFLPITPLSLISNLNRIPAIALYFFRTLSSYEWSFVWILVVLVAIQQGLARRLVPGDFLLLAALLYVIVMGASYLFSAFVPFENHLLSSGYRLVAQVTPLVGLWLALQTRIGAAYEPPLHAPREALTPSVDGTSLLAEDT